MRACHLSTSDAADDSLRVDLGGWRIIKKKKDSPEVRFLYHEGKKRGKRILCKRGKNVSAMASLKWHNENMPLVAAPMQLEKDVASLLG